MSDTPTQYAAVSAAALLLATMLLLAAITARTAALPDIAADASKMTIEVVAEY